MKSSTVTQTALQMLLLGSLKKLEAGAPSQSISITQLKKPLLKGKLQDAYGFCHVCSNHLLCTGTLTCSQDNATHTKLAFCRQCSKFTVYKQASCTSGLCIRLFLLGLAKSSAPQSCFPLATQDFLTCCIMYSVCKVKSAVCKYAGGKETGTQPFRVITSASNKWPSSISR